MQWGDDVGPLLRKAKMTKDSLLKRRPAKASCDTRPLFHFWTSTSKVRR